MDYEAFRRAAQAPLLLVCDPIAAARWETHWLAPGRSDEPLVAARPPVRAVSAALADMLVSEPDVADGLGVISPTQSAALWREVVAGSAHGQSLITPIPAAAAAERAWRLLQEWDVPWETLRPDRDDPDFAALLDWCRAYCRRLQAEGWADRPAIVRRLATSRSAADRYDIAAALSEPLSPMLSRVFERRARNGHVADLAALSVAGRRRFVACEDDEAELNAAAEWAGRRLAEGPESLVAIVIPDARAQAGRIETTVRDRLADLYREDRGAVYWSSCGQPLLEFGAAGAAMNALELVFGQGQFGQLSSFLRSPFFDEDDAESAARRADFEASFRTQLFTQWRFGDAVRQGGLRQTLVEALPVTGPRLARVVDLAVRRGAGLDPTAWVDLWEQVLRLLGWQPATQGTSSDVLAAWDRCLQAFASLSAMIGPVRPGRALAEFRRIAAAATVRAPMSLRGVHVLERPEQAGPGYDGIWITGYTDRRWPEPMRLSPLLPVRLQRAHAMPGSTPQVAQVASQRILSRLLANAADVVFSAPAHVNDEPMRPSRMLKLARGTTAEVAGGTPGYVGRRAGARIRRRLADPVPATRSGDVTGGTRLLELQAQCPLRAFCEIRLDAKALERPIHGVSPRLRGIVLHRALELMFRPCVGRGPLDVSSLEGTIEGAVARALAEHIPWRHAPWDLIAGLEAERARRAISALLAAEEPRARVEIVAVEAPVKLRINGWTIKGRIDRIDRLPDGGLAIIDYKTGTPPAASAWYGERLLAPQMPAYAIGHNDAVSAFVIAAIGDGRVDYRVAGIVPSEFPAMPRPAHTTEEWNARMAVWRGQIAQLLTEFTAGDVRIAVDRPVYAAGEFAALTRLFDSDSLAPVTVSDEAGVDG